MASRLPQRHSARLGLINESYSSKYREGEAARPHPHASPPHPLPFAPAVPSLPLPLPGIPFVGRRPVVGFNLPYPPARKHPPLYQSLQPSQPDNLQQLGCMTIQNKKANRLDADFFFIVGVSECVRFCCLQG